MDGAVCGDKKRALQKYAWETEFGDHFSSPRESFIDLSVALDFFVKKLKIKKEKIMILDPYYCDGSSAKYLSQLGFKAAVNPCQDFYMSEFYKTRKGFDILVTNPPYSQEHKQRALSFAMESKKPWAMLLPAYCCEKDYFPGWDKCLVLKPEMNRKYIFQHPLGVRKKDADTLPQFVWIISPGPYSIDDLAKFMSSVYSPHYTLCRSLSQLAATRAVRGAKRPNPRQRRQLQKKRKLLKGLEDQESSSTSVSSWSKSTRIASPSTTTTAPVVLSSSSLCSSDDVLSPGSNSSSGGGGKMRRSKKRRKK